ncbi:MAG TPA: hypothetical protein VFF11_15435, partial [Candidatus Binatia bacterium]|nr:hypothetical protein [Candidatus Binatia bacterium]
DREIKIRSAEAQAMTVRLQREFGLLVGTSSGANVAAAISIARGLGTEACVVTMLCDRAERYFSTSLFANNPLVIREAVGSSAPLAGSSAIRWLPLGGTGDIK